MIYYNHIEYDDDNTVRYHDDSTRSIVASEWEDGEILIYYGDFRICVYSRAWNLRWEDDL